MRSKKFETLNRGVVEIIEKSSLEERLKSGKTLRVKLGIDPTSPNLHIGRSIPLLKMQDFQKLGHKICLIIGDFTGVVGDTSDKDSERPMLEEDIIARNLKNYKEQAGKLIDLSEAEVFYNSSWLSKLNYSEIGHQADQFSVADFIARENIVRRLELGKRVSLREVLYPLMQGYDSVAINADVELGGMDQKFNILAGRDIQGYYGQRPQDIVLGPLIEGLDGRKMSSSFGNTVNFTDEPNEMFGKIMSIRDELIIRYFNLLTRVPLETVEEYAVALEQGENPKKLKLELARVLVEMYHTKRDAKNALDYFENTFAKKIIPSNIETYLARDFNIVNILVDSGLVESRSEGRRILAQKGIKVDGALVEDPDYVVAKKSVIQKGKIKFIRVS